MPYEPVLLANVRKPNSHTLAVYEAGGGYRGLRRALKEPSAEIVKGYADVMPPVPNLTDHDLQLIVDTLKQLK